MSLDPLESKIQESLSDLEQSMKSLKTAQSKVEANQTAAQQVIESTQSLKDAFLAHQENLKSNLSQFISLAEQNYSGHLNKQINQFSNVANQLQSQQQESISLSLKKLEVALNDLVDFKADHEKQLKNNQDLIQDFFKNQQQAFEANWAKGIQEIELQNQKLEAANQNQESNRQKGFETRIEALKALESSNIEQTHQLQQAFEDFIQKSKLAFSKYTKENTETISKLADEIYQDHQKLHDEQVAFIENQKEHNLQFLAQNVQTHQENAQKINDRSFQLFEEAKENLNQQSKEMQSLFEQQENSIEGYLQELSRFTKQVHNLELRISKIEFPELFEKLNQRILSLENENAQINAQLVLQEENATKRDRLIQQKFQEQAQGIKQLENQQIKGQKYLYVGLFILLICLLILIFRSS